MSSGFWMPSEENIHEYLLGPRGELTINQVQRVGARAISTQCMGTYSEAQRIQHI